MIMANAQDNNNGKSAKKHPMGVGGGINTDRFPSRHDKQRHDNNNHPADSNQAQYYPIGDQKQHQRGPSDRQKTNIVEVLEFDQEVQQPAGSLFYS